MTASHRLLALAPYPNISADTRYRVSQFIPGLQHAGWQVDLHSFMDEQLFSFYNRPGRILSKMTRTLAASGRRLADLLSASHYDAILLHKEAFPFGPPIAERILHARQPRILYDMDDAFWTHPPQFRQIAHTLRDPSRIPKMIALSSGVLAGNQYLVDFARRYNSRIHLFPTVLDTQRYLLRNETPDDEITVGWVGRWSSSPYLLAFSDVFEQLCRANPVIAIRLVGAGDVTFPPDVRYQSIPWRLSTEVEDIAAFDIGIMPLPDDDYSRGKCGFKLLQYMALGIPSVASPVGVNCEIIQDGVNGFLAATEQEWVEKITILATDPALRHRMGLAARETVVRSYSVSTALPALLGILEDLLA